MDTIIAHWVFIKYEFQSKYNAVLFKIVFFLIFKCFKHYFTCTVKVLVFFRPLAIVFEYKIISYFAIPLIP